MSVPLPTLHDAIPSLLDEASRFHTFGGSATVQAPARIVSRRTLSREYRAVHPSNHGDFHGGLHARNLRSTAARKLLRTHDFTGIGDGNHHHRNGNGLFSTASVDGRPLPRTSVERQTAPQPSRTQLARRAKSPPKSHELVGRAGECLRLTRCSMRVRGATTTRLSIRRTEPRRTAPKSTARETTEESGSNVSGSHTAR